MRTENPKHCDPFFGNYLGDFSSEPNAQVQSTVFERQGNLHVYYSFKEGFTWRKITDKWRNEIESYASDKGIYLRDVHYILHPQC
jgi:hypothetical protein